jgi:hypothetical protein
MYSAWAVIFYKNSYSDWHFHPGTEAMMRQVLGADEAFPARALSSTEAARRGGAARLRLWDDHKPGPDQKSLSKTVNVREEETIYARCPYEPGFYGGHSAAHRARI